MSAYPLSLLSNPALNASIDSNGWHGRNGGTSLASPVIAGIAALYLLILVIVRPYLKNLRPILNSFFIVLIIAAQAVYRINMNMS